MMGLSYYQNDFPRMCFNPAKNWQLGWYTNRQIEIQPETLPTEGQEYILNGIVDYKAPTNGEDKYVVMKIDNPSRSDPLSNFNVDNINDLVYDLYIGYNRQSGFNNETLEYANQVNILETVGSSGGSLYSKRLASLSPGNSFEQSLSGGSLRILFNRLESEIDAIVELSWVPSEEPCEDVSTNFEIEVNSQFKFRDCSWVGKNGNVRCDLPLQKGGTGKDECPKTCDNCPGIVVCEDVSNYLCSLVGQKPTIGCEFIFKDGEKGKDKCPVTCGEC